MSEARAGRAGPPAPGCKHCGGPSIAGEGAAVCRVCVRRFGAAAGFPALQTPGVLRMLAEAHGDVVELVMPRTDGRAHWNWIGGAS